MSLLDFISPGITAASDVAGGYAQGQEKLKAQQIQQALLATKEKRQSALDILNARNINSQITTREKEKQGAGSTVISQDGEIYEKQPDGSYSKAKINDAPTPVTPEAPVASAVAPLPSSLSNGHASLSSAPAAVAPPPQGTPKPPPAVPMDSTPKFGPRKPNDPNSPEAIKADSVKSANAAKNQKQFGYHAPPTQFSFGTGVDSTGKTVTTTQNVKTGVVTPTGIEKPATTASGSLRGLGQGGVFGAGSGIGAVKEMQAANPNLKTFEKGFLTDTPQTASQLGALDRFRQRLANDLQTHGLITAATASEAERELAATNPDLVVYGRNLKQWIVADLNLSRSATDKRGALDMEVSGLSMPLSSMPLAQRQAYINQIWEARDARLSGLQTAANTAQVMLDRVTGKKATAKPALNQKQYNDGIARGLTPAQIAEHYDLSQVKQ